MLTSLRGPMAAFSALAAVALWSPAQAQTVNPADEVTPPTEASPFTFSGNAAVTSDYRFRGISLSGGDFAVQGGLDINHESGFYVGTWGSSIDDGGTGLLGDIEVDLYAGWTGEITEGVTLDAGLLYYLYPTKDLNLDTDYFEPYVSLSTTLGPVEATVGANYAFAQSALGDEENLYLHTELSAGIPGTPLTANAHLGYTDGIFAPPFLAGTGEETGFDWSLGVAASWKILELSVSYVGTEGPSIKNFTDDAFVVTLSASF